MPASRSKTCRALVSPPKRCSFGRRDIAFSSGTLRHRKDGTSFSRTRLVTVGTPALRKYFCASTSAATWLHALGTSKLSSLKTVLPSGLRISEVACLNGMASYGVPPASVNLRSIFIVVPRPWRLGGARFPCPATMPPAPAAWAGVVVLNARRPL